MVPKPFPFQIGVGVDICRINRIASILRPVSTRNRWARRVFTRLEWPALCRRFDCAANAKKECDEESEVLKNRSDRNGKLDHADKIDSAAWMLPSLSPYSSILEDEDETAYWSAIADDRSALGVLARHLAGRLGFLRIPLGREELGR